MIAAWDGLILAVAGYILTAVGRVHQLFGGLEALHLAALAGVIAIALYIFDGSAERRARRCRVRPPSSSWRSSSG